MDLMGLNRDIMGIYHAIIHQLHYDLGVSKDGVYHFNRKPMNGFRDSMIFFLGSDKAIKSVRNLEPTRMGI